METRIDLDTAAEEVELRRDAWLQGGISVGALTWRDQARRWPEVIVESRQDAIDPDSLKLVLERGVAVAEPVLYRGGWADIEWANRGQAVEDGRGDDDIAVLFGVVRRRRATG